MLQQGILLAFCITLVLGCSSQSAPIVSREQPPGTFIKTHLVEKGETLYSIAWRYDSSVEVLAKINELAYPYALEQGQILNLDTDAVEDYRSSKSARIVDKVMPSDSRVNNNSLSNVVSVVKNRIQNLRWQSPVKGRIVEGYNPKALRKGVVIETVKDALVRSAASGVVVYAGDGLRDYGKLVIIKHTESLLSAYGHNQKILVSEGQTVNNKQVISKLGPSGRLYFEIRKDGNPVNPLSYLH